MSELSLERLAAEIERLQSQVAELTNRLNAGGAPPLADADSGDLRKASVRPSEAAPEHEISPEILLAISAAVAAYLGERAHIRAVRLISHTRWSQEGRVSLQASHHLSRG